VKNTRASVPGFRVLTAILLGGCASLAAASADVPAATLQTNAPLSGAAIPSGVDTRSHLTGLVTPTRLVCSSQLDALLACENCATVNGGTVVTTSGTPSMEPLIHGKSYAVIVKRPYESIAKRDILVYMGRPDASKPDRMKMLHRAVLHDKYGWMMSGDNNRWSESWDRVTPETYVGIVVALFEYPQT
jgi:hypothetical protein